jgi:hypothetical protein
MKHVHASAIPWTPEQEDELRRLAAEGLSAAEISRRLSIPRSRNAVLGRARRMGVKVGMTMEEMAALAREAREGIARPRLPLSHEEPTEAEARLFWITTAPVAPVASPQLKPGRPSIQPTPEGRSVYELTHSCCRWIEGEPSDPRPYKCTSVVTEVGTSWCPVHFKRAYAKQPPMRLRVRELA